MYFTNGSSTVIFGKDYKHVQTWEELRDLMKTDTKMLQVGKPKDSNAYALYDALKSTVEFMVGFGIDKKLDQFSDAYALSLAAFHLKQNLAPKDGEVPFQEHLFDRLVLKAKATRSLTTAMYFKIPITYTNRKTLKTHLTGNTKLKVVSSEKHLTTGTTDFSYTTDNLFSNFTPLVDPLTTHHYLPNTSHQKFIPF